MRFSSASSVRATRSAGSSRAALPKTPSFSSSRRLSCMVHSPGRTARRVSPRPAVSPKHRERDADELSEVRTRRRVSLDVCRHVQGLPAARACQRTRGSASPVTAGRRARLSPLIRESHKGHPQGGLGSGSSSAQRLASKAAIEHPRIRTDSQGASVVVLAPERHQAERQPARHRVPRAPGVSGAAARRGSHGGITARRAAARGPTFRGMATTSAAIDRARLLELIERERAALLARTAAVAGRVRARRDGHAARRAELVPGRRPAADLPLARRGLGGVGRRRQRVRRLPQRLRRHVRRPREPGDRARPSPSAPPGARTSPRRPTARSSSRRSCAAASACRSGGSRTPAPSRRWTRSTSPAAPTGRDLVLKIEGSYHGHHDAVMVSVRPPLDAARPARRAGQRPVRRRQAEGGHRPHEGDRLQRRRPPRARARRHRRPGRGADPRAGDDEHHDRLPEAGLPRARARAVPRATASS